jgi:hypothetical protein
MVLTYLVLHTYILSTMLIADNIIHLILSPYFNARLGTLMLSLSTADTSPCTGGVSSVIKLGGVQLGLVFVFKGGNVHVLNSSVHFARMVDNLVLKVQYFGHYKKTKHYSSIEKCSS